MSRTPHEPRCATFCLDCSTSCPKCHTYSGNNWRQCEGRCPIPSSPHYDPDYKPPYLGLNGVITVPGTIGTIEVHPATDGAVKILVYGSLAGSPTFDLDSLRSLADAIGTRIRYLEDEVSIRTTGKRKCRCYGLEHSDTCDHNPYVIRKKS